MTKIRCLMIALFAFSASAMFSTSVQASGPACEQCDHLFWSCLTNNPNYWDQCYFNAQKCQIRNGCPVWF